MKNTEYEILSLFKGNPSVELGTKEIVLQMYSQEAQEAENALVDQFSSKETKKSAKKTLATLHRRILHHLNRLIFQHTLEVSRVEGKGKKYFKLALQEGEELVLDKFKRKIIITKPTTPTLPLGDFEQKGIVYRVGSDSFFDSLNSILLEGDKFSNLPQSLDFVSGLFHQVNDVIGINDFETVIQKFEIQEIVNFLLKLEEDCAEYDRQICCIIDFTNIQDELKLSQFFETFLSKSHSVINFILDVTSREFLAKNVLIETLIRKNAQNRTKLSIKNDDLFNAPYIIGKSGPYCFTVSEWNDYVKNCQKSSVGLICTQSSMVIDLAKFYRDSPSAKALSELLFKLTKALFFANAYQRKNSDEYFKKLSNPSLSSLDYQVFNYSKNIIRFWNYEINNEVDADAFLLDTLLEIRKQLEDFSKNQETIYLSCGMPTNFKVAFSVAYRQFNKFQPLVENFTKVQVRDSKDLYSEEFKQHLKIYERGSNIFDGGSEIRFTRVGGFEPLDVMREINIIMNAYRIPFFCYNFVQQTGGNKKLFDYLENGN
jgi:hypothetical protein